MVHCNINVRIEEVCGLSVKELVNKMRSYIVGGIKEIHILGKVKPPVVFTLLQLYFLSAF